MSGALRLDREDFADVVRVREAAQADLAATPVLRANGSWVNLRRSTRTLVSMRDLRQSCRCHSASHQLGRSSGLDCPY